MYFFLLILKIFFNLALNAIYKYGKFSKVLLEESLKFILDKKVDLVLFF